LGFAFLNFFSPEDAAKFKFAFRKHMFAWPGKAGFRKRATVSAARVQGFHANMEKVFELGKVFDGDRMSLCCRVKGGLLAGAPF